MALYNLLTPLGLLTLIAANGRLIYCNWVSPECEPKKVKALKMASSILPNPDDEYVLNLTRLQLLEYFDGSRKVFELSISPGGTPFQQKVWKEMLTIEYGEVSSYKELAEKCSMPKSFRAVAQACGANPIVIITPCHRIISSDGSLGGYTGGLHFKKALLDMESKKF